MLCQDREDRAQKEGKGAGIEICWPRTKGHAHSSLRLSPAHPPFTTLWYAAAIFTSFMFNNGMLIHDYLTATLQRNECTVCPGTLFYQRKSPQENSLAVLRNVQNSWELYPKRLLLLNVVVIHHIVFGWRVKILETDMSKLQKRNPKCSKSLVLQEDSKKICLLLFTLSWVLKYAKIWSGVENIWPYFHTFS